MSEIEGKCYKCHDGVGHGVALLVRELHNSVLPKLEVSKPNTDITCYELSAARAFLTGNQVTQARQKKF